MKNSRQKSISAGQIKLRCITSHPCYDLYNELLTITDYVLTSGQVLTDVAISILFALHPVIVVKHKKDKDQYLCVGGFRTLLIAKSILDLDTEIPVVLRDGLTDENINLLINADVLLTHLLFSVKRPETIGSIYRMVSSENLSELLDESAQSKYGFAAKTSYVYNSLFPKNEE